MLSILKEDLNLLNSIIEITNKISKIYYNLYTLDINNQKNTEEYKKQLDYLSICLDIENELYKKTNYKNLYLYMEYLDEKKIFRYYQDFDSLLDFDHNLIIKKRIYNRLNNINFSNLINIYQNDINKKNDDPSFDHLIFLNKEINNDIEKSVIYFSLEKNKKDLLKIKYIITFLNKDIENNLDIFKDNLNLNLSFSNSLTTLLQVDEVTYNKLLKKYYLKYIKHHINNLLSIKDTDYLNQTKIDTLECIIRSFLEININNLDYLKESIHDIIKVNKNNKTSIYILEKLLMDIKNNKKIKILKTERLVLNETSN